MTKLQKRLYACLRHLLHHLQLLFLPLQLPPPLTVSAETQAEIKIPVISWEHLGEICVQSVSGI